MVLERALCAVLLIPLGLVPLKGAHTAFVALIAHDNTVVRASASRDGRVLAVLVQQTQVKVVRQAPHWDKIRLWGSLQGYVRPGDVVRRKRWEGVSHYRAPAVRYRVRAHASQPLHLAGVVTSPLPTSRAAAAGRRIPIAAWKQDAQGHIWFRSSGSWLPSENLRLVNGPPGPRLAERVSGKGMWLTLGIAPSNPDVVARTAARDGVTHLYIESAISPLGFHGKDSVGSFIEAAHRYHLRIIAWVYPYLYDIASDVALTRQVAAFRTASGQRFDGIAADLERNMSAGPIRAYSELIRAYLGPSYLLVGVTYPPQSLPSYPFAEVARQYNVIAPMDYWHETKTSFGLGYNHLRYGYAYAYRYAEGSIASIRDVAANVPIEPIGQTFDDFGRLEMGPHAPSASEVRGFMAGSRAGGAIGISFFQWLTADYQEWQAIKDFRYNR